MQMQVIKQNDGKTKQCERHASNKVKQVWKMMRKMWEILHACCPPLCFDFAPRFASFSALCPVSCISHCFPAPLHGFLHPFELLFAFCIVLRALQYFPHFSHRFPRLLYFIACMLLALLGFPAILFYRLHLHIGP
jgi:hypothetical protein